MRSRFVLGAILALVLIGVLAYTYGGSQVPPGQPPLESLTPRNLEGIKSAFNASKDDVRVLLLLSPT